MKGRVWIEGYPFGKGILVQGAIIGAHENGKSFESVTTVFIKGS